MKIYRFLAVVLLFLIVQTVPAGNSYSQSAPGAEQLRFDAGYQPKIGEKIYILKRENGAIRKVEGVISGIKKNRDDSIYMLVTFSERAQPGAPVFRESGVIGMVYRHAASDGLFEVMPVKVVLDFMSSLDLPAFAGKVQAGNEELKLPADKISLVQEYLKARNYEKARDILKGLLEISPESSRLHGWMGIVMVETGNAADAEAEFGKAISIEPMNADFHNGLGYAMLSAGNFEGAIASFKEAVRLNPKHADAHYGLGQAYLAIGKINLATKEYGILKDLNSKMADSLFQSIIGRGKIEAE